MCCRPGITFLLVSLVGCQNSPRIHDRPVAVEGFSSTEVKSQMPLYFWDARPRWEKRSHDGAIDFVAMERCADCPWRELSDTILDDVRSWDRPPGAVTLKLQSFRVIFKDEEQMRQVEESKWINQVVNKNNEDGNLGGTVCLIAVIAIPAAAILLTEEIAQRLGLLVQPPANLGQKYPFDVTCEIRATVILFWNKGKPVEIELRCSKNSGPRREGESRYRGKDVENVVGQAVRDLCQQWHGKASLCQPQ